nr:hypothetical protein [Candidatus Sigynarchaeota archaeon]
MSEKKASHDGTLQIDKIEPVFDFSFAGTIESRSRYEEKIKLLNLVIEHSRARYSQIIQFGAKTGETYFEHAIKGIHTIVQLADLIFSPLPSADEASLERLIITCLAYLVHDMNKFPWNKGKGKETYFSDTAIIEELRAVNAASDNAIDAMLPGWDKYKIDMMIMIRGHSLATGDRAAELLLGAPEKYVPADRAASIIPLDELSRLIDVLRLVDVLDLSRQPSRGHYTFKARDKDGKPYDEDIDHAKIIDHVETLLSRIAREAVKILSLRVVKNASRFTNVLANSAIATLSEKYSIFPLRVFSTGAFLYVKKRQYHSMTDGENIPKASKVAEIESAIAAAFVGRIDRFMMARLPVEGFIYEQTSMGVKIHDYVYQQPNAKEKMALVIAEFAMHLPPFAIKEEKYKDSSRYKSILSMEKYVDKDVMSLPGISKWQGGSNRELLLDNDRWKIAKFLHTVYFAIMKLNDKIDPVVLMKELLVKIGIEPALRGMYDANMQMAGKIRKSSVEFYRYAFFHLVGDAIVSSGKTMDGIAGLAKDLVLEKMDEFPTTESFMENPESFVRDHLQLFDVRGRSSDLIQDSSPENANQCCSCGKRMPTTGSKTRDEKTYKWYAEKVPEGVPVEKFSNLLKAGMRSKPRRMVCKSCEWRVYLDAILSPVSGKFASWYPVFYIPDGYPRAMIVSIQKELEKLRQANPGLNSFMVSMKGPDIEGFGKIAVTVHEAYGFTIPSIPDEVCCSIPLDWRIKDGIPVAEQYFTVLSNILHLARKTRMRVALTKLRNDYEEMMTTGDIFLQEIPDSFSWLLGETHELSFEKAELALAVLSKVKEIAFKVAGGKDTDEVAVGIIDNARRGMDAVLHYLEPKRQKIKQSKERSWSMAGDVVQLLHEVNDIKIKIDALT